MNKVTRLSILLLLLFCMSVPATAKADTLDNLIDVLVTAGVVDPAIRDARELINCLVNQSPQQCVGGELETSGFMPDDPAVRAVVDVVKAAYQSDWLKVLEVTGTDVLFQVVCKAGLSTTGPFNDFVCGGLFPKVVAKGKPVVRQVLVAIGSGNIGDWVALVTMAGPQLGCELIPDSIPGKDAVCGPLGKVLAFASDAISDAANAVWGGINNIGDWVSGQDKHMDRDHYYALYWQPWYHYGTWLGTVNNWQEWGTLLAYIRDPCEHYFDTHTMSQDNAQELCDGQRDRFSSEVHAFKNALDVAPDAYYEMAIKDLPAIYAIEDYGKQTNNSKRTFVNGLCETHMRGVFPFPEPDQARCDAFKASADQTSGQFKDMLMQLYNKCVTDQNTQQPNPTVWSYVCKPLGNRFVAELDQERAKLDDKLRDLVIAGCLPPAGWGPADGINLKCINYQAFDKCLDTFRLANPTKYCSLDKVKADNKLARTIRNELGLKRCGLNGDTTVVCTRFWKRDRCEVLRKEAIQGLSQPSALRCELMFDSSYTSGLEKANEIVHALNTISSGGVTPGSSAGDSNTTSDSGQLKYSLAKKPVAAMQKNAAKRLHPISDNNCATTWDPLAIHCKDSSVLQKLNSNYPDLHIPQICMADPNYDGSSVPCYSGVIQISSPGSNQRNIDKVLSNRYDKQDVNNRMPSNKKDKAKAAASASSRNSSLPHSGSKAVPYLPDIATRNTLTVSGALVHWGKTHRIAKNLSNCTIQVVYHVGNYGKADSKAFAMQWLDVNQHKQVKLQRIYGLKKGVEYLKNVEFTLHPGVNRFQLTLDSSSEISEINEANNNLLLSIQYDGACGSIQTKSSRQMGTTRTSNTKSSSESTSSSSSDVKKRIVRPMFRTK
ncbi:MAG: CARDB domain-containing protein [Gammaproteobacteria bacterium]